MNLKLLSAAFLIPIVSAQAQVLVGWDFTSNLNGTIIDTTSSVDSVAAASGSGATVSQAQQAGGTNLSAGGNTGSGLNYIAPYEAGTASTGPQTFLQASGFGTSPSASSYISFSLTMAASIDPSVNQLEGIQFNLANGGNSTRGVEVTYRIGTSGSFTSLGTTATPTNTAGQYGLFTFNLSSPANLSAGDVIEFRLLGYAPASGNTIRLDTVRITAVPEPSTFALILAAGGMLLFLRRRARTS